MPFFHILPVLVWPTALGRHICRSASNPQIHSPVASAVTVNASADPQGLSWLHHGLIICFSDGVFFSISHVDFCGFMWLHVDVYLVCCSCGLMWMDVVSVFCIYFSSPRSCPCKSADFTKLILPQENLLRLAAKHPLRLWKWGGWGFEGPTMRYRNKYWALDLGLSTEREREIYIYVIYIYMCVCIYIYMCVCVHTFAVEYIYTCPYTPIFCDVFGHVYRCNM